MFRSTIQRNSHLLAKRQFGLKSKLEEIIPKKRDQFTRLKKEHSDLNLGQITFANAFGGMRGLKAMLWEGSVLDADEGIRFHGYSIPDCQKLLPKAEGGDEMLPESMFWLVLTGEIPTKEQVKEFSAVLAEKGELPDWLLKTIDAFPSDLHPMTQMAMAVSALNHTSTFAPAYAKGIKKDKYWETTFDDSIDLLAKLPAIAAKIVLRYKATGSSALPSIDPSKDMTYNLAKMMKMEKDEGFVDLLRLYLAIHGDHEGGNVSAHTAHLVGSALADPYLSYSAALQGLAGPLHGLANQESLRFVIGMRDALQAEPTEENVKEFLWNTLNSGKVIPGYGHAVLRKPDPRFMALTEFSEKRQDVKDDILYKLVMMNYKVAVPVLKEHGKTKNPYPNVDAQSGVLLYHYGLTEVRFYTVIFGVSRAIGALAQLIWDRALGLPIERPKSVSLATIEAMTKK